MTFYPYVRSNGSRGSVLPANTEDQQVNFGNHSGSSFEEHSCPMYADYRTAPKRDIVVPDITSTKNGHFIVELNGVKSGTYAL